MPKNKKSNFKVLDETLDAMKKITDMINAAAFTTHSFWQAYLKIPKEISEINDGDAIAEIIKHGKPVNGDFVNIKLGS